MEDKVGVALDIMKWNLKSGRKRKASVNVIVWWKVCQVIKGCVWISYEVKII